MPPANGVKVRVVAGNNDRSAQLVDDLAQQVDHFFMIASGEVDIVLSSPGCPEIVLACLGEGQFFGEVELLHSENSIASARAAATGPVELSLLPKDSFRQLLRGSPPTQEMVAQVAQMRLGENRARNGNCEE